MYAKTEIDPPIALIALPYYRPTNPVIVEQSRSVIDAVLHDVGG